MDQNPAEKEINRIEREIDATKSAEKSPPIKRGGDQSSGDQAEQSGNRSLDAVLATAVLLFVVSAALVFAGRLSPNQRMQLTAGSIGGAVGLLVGYGVGRVRP